MFDLKEAEAKLRALAKDDPSRAGEAKDALRLVHSVRLLQEIGVLPKDENSEPESVLESQYDASKAQEQSRKSRKK